MATMARLERFRGHFYNWYDTESLRALDPQYVSSVDSGNLAGHLIALANACREWCEAPLEDERRLAGIVDALDLVREEVGSLRDGAAPKPSPGVSSTSSSRISCAEARPGRP